MKKPFKKYASVILDVSINKTLDYGIPDNLLETVQAGTRVEVPLRGQARKGYVFETKDNTAFSRVLPVKDIVSEEVVITPELFELAVWMSRYYCAPLHQVLKTVLPSSVRRDTKPKEQLYVQRKKSREVLRELAKELRNKKSSQAAVLDVMLEVKDGILLSELQEMADVSRSPVMTLEKSGALAVDIVRIDRSPLVDAEYFKTRPKKLHEEQGKALDKIKKTLNDEAYETHLLFGVTGSGKTEVYLQAIDHALSMKKSTIMLVPEIALTAQTIERFRSRFEGHIAILHHRLSHGERFDEWKRIQRGEAKIVIGARSAIFSPAKDLGLIIVDEEHESSYKQNDDAPCYNARDVAVMRGHMNKAAVILGSATPSLESYHNSQKGKYTLSKLMSRADSARVPTVHIVDMKREYEKAKGFTSFSDALIAGIKKRCEAGEQSILFLNRRGYHTTFLCQSCNEAVQCKRCSVSMTFHRSTNQLSCHLCGYTIPLPKQCPSCKSYDTMKFKGVGTELVEKALHAILPDVRTLRADADTTRHKGSHQRLLRAFSNGKADVLIGTQMVAKGLHFPQVTLVGVLNSDLSLSIPDFRSSEETFQLITQVSGRSGRATLPGEVIIQTRDPNNSVIGHAANQDFEAFFAEEITSRQAFSYPPFAHLVKVRFSGTNEDFTKLHASRFQEMLKRQVSGRFELYPVITAGHAKIKERYYFHFLGRGHDIYFFNESIENILRTHPTPSKVRMNVDIDPMSTFF